MMRIILIVFLATITFATESRANTTSSRVIAPKPMNITVRQLSPIAFGTFASSGSGGTITIEAGSGARIQSGDISTLSGGDYGQAEFAIAGQPGREIVITPPASVVLGKTGGGDMIITNFKVSPAEILTLDQTGTAKIKIGGILKVPGSVSQGTYNGFFNVTVRYTR